MHKLQVVLKDEAYTILLDFTVQTHPLNVGPEIRPRVN